MVGMLSDIMREDAEHVIHYAEEAMADTMEVILHDMRSLLREIEEYHDKKKKSKQPDWDE